MTASSPKPRTRRSASGKFRPKPPTEPFDVYGVTWVPSDEVDCPVGFWFAVEVHTRETALNTAGGEPGELEPGAEDTTTPLARAT